MEIRIFFKVLDTLLLFPFLDTIYETSFFNTALHWLASDFILFMMLLDMDPLSSSLLDTSVHFFLFFPAFAAPFAFSLFNKPTKPCPRQSNCQVVGRFGQYDEIEGY
jgi:hypothetical protein